MSCWAAATPNASISSREDLNVGIIAMRFWAELACGKSIRGRADQNGRFFRKAIKLIMELYFLRHGEADWPDWKKSDDERPLTDFGKKEVRDVAKFLARLKVRPDLIVTSPLPRAAQTAEIAADYLKPKLRKDELLAPGFGMSEFRRATLQIALADFNHGKQLVTFALPLRFTMFVPQSCAKKTQIVRTTQQIG